LAMIFNVTSKVAVLLPFKYTAASARPGRNAELAIATLAAVIRRGKVARNIIPPDDGTSLMCPSK
jgi:hypothetical protein